MTQARRNTLRDLMLLAWDLFRAEQHGPSPRTFADALMGAWRWFKGRPVRRAVAPLWANGDRPMHLPLRSMVQSPIRRSISGTHRESRARSLGYVTSTLGR